MRVNASSPRQWTKRQYLLAALVMYCAACATASWQSEPSKETQSWWEGYGPVIPHETFPADCTLCHLEGNWNELRPDFTFDHAVQTGVPLEGAHLQAQCLRCHNDRGPVAMFSARGCSGCHVDVHEGNQGMSCETCHGESDWTLHAHVADHNRTRFPLLGAHAGTACRQCHLGIERGQLEPLPTDCAACHQEQAALATQPDHTALGWTNDCARCHRATQWAGVGFTHSAWPLTGQHAVIDCTACHSGGVFAGTPTDCFACHQTDYQGTNDPDHAALGFPTNCEACHNTSTWDGAVFQHDFNIDSGRHSSLDCDDCHTIPMSSAFSCTHCHEHRQSEADDEHEGVSGYVWSSPACYNCHPDGSDILPGPMNSPLRVRRARPKDQTDQLRRVFEQIR